MTKKELQEKRTKKNLRRKQLKAFKKRVALEKDLMLKRFNVTKQELDQQQQEELEANGKEE